MNTPVLMSGRVVKEGGEMPSGGVVVRLLAWPAGRELASLEDGDTFTLTPIARTSTDSDGHYELRVDPSVDLGRFESEDGLVEVSLDVQAPEGQASYQGTVAPEEALGGTFSSRAAGDEVVEPSLPSELDLTLEPAGSVARSDVPADDDGLVHAQYVNLGVRWTNVGALFIKVTGVWGELQHLSGANAELGVGVASNNGSYSASGTVNRASDTTIGFGRHGRYTYQFFDTQRPYARYTRWNCSGTRSTSTVQPLAYGGNAGGRSRSASAHIPPNQPRSRCAPYAPTFFHDQSKTKATTWATGAKVASLIGIDLSSRTGYTTTTKTRFEFVSAGRAVCGTRAHPASATGPGTLVVQMYP
ncbi:hypothetical protein [Actinoalloteichus caeruleus]|uniref:hypothetical protein n=1 Tax=Actinoalloteichus cyanogriseus TaxID=2893586 RepID=UPI003BB89C32